MAIDRQWLLTTAGGAGNGLSGVTPVPEASQKAAHWGSEPHNRTLRGNWKPAAQGAPFRLGATPPKIRSSGFWSFAWLGRATWSLVNCARRPGLARDLGSFAFPSLFDQTHS